MYTYNIQIYTTWWKQRAERRWRGQQRGGGNPSRATSVRCSWVKSLVAYTNKTGYGWQKKSHMVRIKNFDPSRKKWCADKTTQNWDFIWCNRSLRVWNGAAMYKHGCKPRSVGIWGPDKSVFFFTSNSNWNCTSKNAWVHHEKVGCVQERCF